MNLFIKNQYLHFPVKNGAEKITFQFLLAGEMVREFEVELAVSSEPDWWAFYDVSEFKGKEIVIITKGRQTRKIEDQLPRLIEQDEKIKDAENLYKEKLRPQFHFSARRGWNNDPNGMVYYNGEYHLFFQHNPFGIKWGNMHWGHAVSKDLVHWQELPIALYPNSLNDMAFSGGGLVDQGNTAGFKTGEEDVIVVSFTSTGRGECIAYSNDCGRHFEEYGGNPVIKHRGRDPKIIWYKPEDKWVMVVYDQEEDSRRYAFYESRNLKSWKYLSAIDGFFECPEFFELPVDGDENNRKWVLYGAAWREDERGNRHATRSSYMIGSFDGKNFNSETEIIDGHLGPNFYAAQTFSNVPGGRRLMIGWMSGAEFPGMPFNQCMTIPLELGLRTTSEGIRLFFTPAAEITSLYSGKEVYGNQINVTEANDLFKCVSAELLDINLEIEHAESGEMMLIVRRLPIIYNFETHELTSQGKTGILEPVDGKIDLRILVDRSVIEIFGNDGLISIAAGGDIFAADDNNILLKGDGQVKIFSLKINEMQSAWQ